MNSQDNKRSIFAWMKDYPIKTTIITLLIVVPLFLLILFSVNFTNKGKRFYFEKVEDKPVYINASKISKDSKVEQYLDLNITLKEITSYSTGGKTYPLGAYKFETSYKAATQYKNANFKFKWLLNANWTDIQTESSNANINTTTNTQSIYFPYETPARKYLFFKVGKPTLIVEITITLPVNPNLPTGEAEIIKVYTKVDLNKINYAYDIR